MPSLIYLLTQFHRFLYFLRVSGPFTGGGLDLAAEVGPRRVYYIVGGHYLGGSVFRDLHELQEEKKRVPTLRYESFATFENQKTLWFLSGIFRCIQLNSMSRLEKILCSRIIKTIKQQVNSWKLEGMQRPDTNWKRIKTGSRPHPKKKTQAVKPHLSWIQVARGTGPLILFCKSHK